jgi:SAM-dependent methyltransferase
MTPVIAYRRALMSAVEETTQSRWIRRGRHAVRLATTPRLWREQIEFMRHGPSPTAPPPVDVTFPASPWRDPPPGTGCYCNVCGWEGAAFDGPRHVESQLCPRCGSSGRDRFLLFCFVSRTPRRRWLRVLETSPRLGEDYRAAMAQWFNYMASDYDISAHRASIRLDLQQIDLPPRSLDVLLTAHVLEHIPDTDGVLDGIRRTLAPGGRVYLQVPVLEGVTVAPAVPEFHEDNTRVLWRFGFDLAHRMRQHGFATTVLGTAPFVEAVRTGDRSLVDGDGSEWDVPAMIAEAKGAGLVSVLTQAGAERLGIGESYQFVTFEGVVPAGTVADAVRASAQRAWRRIRS